MVVTDGTIALVDKDSNYSWEPDNAIITKSATVSDMRLEKSAATGVESLFSDLSQSPSGQDFYVAGQLKAFGSLPEDQRLMEE